MKNYLLIILALIISTVSGAQEGDTAIKKGFQREKLFLGGNFGLSFGDYTLINISPQLGYRFTDFFAAGLGLNFQYNSYKQRFQNGDPYRKESRGIGGLNAFGRIYPIKQIMLQVQPEMNYVFGKEIYFATPQSQRQEYNLDAAIVPSLLMGGGAVLPSGRGAFIIAVFYDVLQKDNNPYGSRPVYYFGFNIGL